MKRIYIKTILWPTLLVALMCITSCSDFLNEENLTQLSETQVMSDEKLAEINLKSIYSSFKNLYKDEQCWFLLQGTDEIQCGALQAKDANTAAWDYCDGAMNSENNYVKKSWEMRWSVITSAAKIVRAMKKTNPPLGSKAAQLAGEAAFLRGFMNYQTAMIWGRIPILDLEKIDAGQLNYGRQPLKDVWQFIINDFTQAANMAPTQNDPDRVTCFAGWLMLARAYMSAPQETGLRDFAKAKEALDHIISSGKYQLLDNYNDLWDYNKDASKEVILTTTFTAARNYANQVQFQIGSRACAKDFGDACYFSGYDHSVPTIHAYESVDKGGVWEKGDTRREYSIRYDFTYNGRIPTLKGLEWEGLSPEDHDELLPHIKKYEDYRTDRGSGLGINNMWLSGKNIPIIRYADVLLCYAECLNELGQTALAETYVNIVRDRAFEGAQPPAVRWNGLSKETFRENLQDERIRELFAENWRRYDLVRTGKWSERLKKYNKWGSISASKGTFKEHIQYWPIPLTELNQNKDMRTADNLFDQNEGYQ